MQDEQILTYHKGYTYYLSRRRSVAREIRRHPALRVGRALHYHGRQYHYPLIRRKLRPLWKASVPSLLQPH